MYKQLFAGVITECNEGNAHLHITLKSDEIALLITSECALTPHPIFGRDLCLKCVPEVAGGNNLTNRQLVGRNTKRFSAYSLNLFVLIRVY